MATLIIVDGPAEGQQFALGPHRLVMIGRDDQCTFQVLDNQMSRQHFQVKQDMENGGHIAIDRGSSNGVLVNGARIAADTRLANGDEIRAGLTCMLYATEDSPDAKTINSLMRKHGEHLKGTIVDPELKG